MEALDYGYKDESSIESLIQWSHKYENILFNKDALEGKSTKIQFITTQCRTWSQLLSHSIMLEDRLETSRFIYIPKCKILSKLKNQFVEKYSLQARFFKEMYVKCLRVISLAHFVQLIILAHISFLQCHVFPLNIFKLQITNI